MKLVELTSKAQKKRQQTEATVEASDAEAESGNQAENGSAGGSSLTLGGDDDNNGDGRDDTTISTGSDWATSSQSQHRRRPQLGPGAWHVLPRTNLMRHSRTDAAMTTSAGLDPGLLTTTTRPVDGGVGAGGDDVVHIVTATLVPDDGDSGGTPTNESALASTLVTHALSEDDSGTGGGSSNDPPALFLVDQRVVDKRIFDLKGEHRRTLSKHRRVICAALFVLLAIVVVVSIVVPLTSNRGAVPAAAPLELKSDWSTCTTSSECRVWVDGIGCCSGKYSGGVSKCTPLSPWFDERTNECIIGEPVNVVPTTVSSDAASNGLKKEWIGCQSSTECQVWAEGLGCCTGKYTDGVTQCTPLSPWFDIESNDCIVDHLKPDWQTCDSSAECRVWAEETGCCSGKYSDGVAKCTPLSPGFNVTTNGCIVAATDADVSASTPDNGSAKTDLKGDWSKCETSIECKAWADEKGCCSGKYSGGVSKCTPLSPEFNQTSNECIVDDTAAASPGSSAASTPDTGSVDTKLKGDWSKCESSTECRAWADEKGCCTSKYSGGVSKCTPLSPNFNFESNGCIMTSAPFQQDSCTIAMKELERRETPASGGSKDEFYGMWSSIFGTTAVIGCPGSEAKGPDGEMHKLGRVHIFDGKESDSKDGSDSKLAWEETIVLEPSTRATKFGLAASFGFRVALSGDVLAVTAFIDGTRFRRVGMVYVFRRGSDTSSWLEEAIILPPQNAQDDNALMATFGTQIAVSGDTVAISSPKSHNGKGAVYVFSRRANVDGTVLWAEEAKLESSDGAEKDEFGSSLAIHGQTIVSGSVLAKSGNGKTIGKAYIFSKNAKEYWIEASILTSSDGRGNTDFGFSVAIYDGIIAIGAPFAGASRDGAVYVYACSGGGDNISCEERATLSADNASEFGGSLALHGSLLAIGAPSTPTPTSSAEGEGGGAYVYKNNGGTWTLQNKFQYRDTMSLGRSIGISKTALVAADPVYKRNGLEKSGAAFIANYLLTEC